eukprot:Filipodium_phascolosomae@DN2404_c0_g1_i10.p1
MRSVGSIQKITKAMKMVAASKLRADQRRLDMCLPFSVPLPDLIRHLPIDEEAKNASGKTMIVLGLSSDKGLCGGINSAVAKATRQQIVDHEANGGICKMVGIGDKIRAALNRVLGNRFAQILSECNQVAFNFDVASIIAQKVQQMNPDMISLIHNHFKTVISFETKAFRLLSDAEAAALPKKELDAFEFEPERSAVWKVWRRLVVRTDGYVRTCTVTILHLLSMVVCWTPSLLSSLPE